MTGIVAGEVTDESISLRSTSRININLNNNTNANVKMELNNNRKIMIKIVIDFIILLCGKKISSFLFIKFCQFHIIFFQKFQLAYQFWAYFYGAHHIKGVFFVMMNR